MPYVTLEFSGGSDEGHMNYEHEEFGENPAAQNAIDAFVEWADDAYAYDGDSDGGGDFGDMVTYDIVNGKTVHQGWRMEPSYGEKACRNIAVEL